MAKFLNTSATNYFLEELIKNAKDRLILISPFLKLNDRMRELLADKNRLKIDMRIVYGKSELAPEEMNWLKTQTYIRTSFCKNLHAKCYLNEEFCIITSLNLYEFSQINNNEMGVLINRNEDAELYKDTYEEAQRIIRISEEVNNTPLDIVLAKPEQKIKINNSFEKLTTSKLAQKLELKTDELTEKLINLGYLEIRDDKQYLTTKGKEIGGEVRTGRQFGVYFLWSVDFNPEVIKKLRTAELAEKIGLTSKEMMEKLVQFGYLKSHGDKFHLTAKGKAVGGEERIRQSGCTYFWSESFALEIKKTISSLKKVEQTKPHEVGKIKLSKLAEKLGFSTNELIVKLIHLEYLEIRDKKPYLTEKGKLSGGELRAEQSGYNCFWAENFFLEIEKINSVNLAKKLGITTNEVINKLVKSDYLKQEIGKFIFPDKYYLTEKGGRVGIEEQDTGFTHEERFLYPENIQF